MAISRVLGTRPSVPPAGCSKNWLLSTAALLTRRSFCVLTRVLIWKCLPHTTSVSSALSPERLQVRIVGEIVYNGQIRSVGTFMVSISFFDGTPAVVHAEHIDFFRSSPCTAQEIMLMRATVLPDLLGSKQPVIDSLGTSPAACSYTRAKETGVAHLFTQSAGLRHSCGLLALTLRSLCVDLALTLTCW